MKSGRIEPEIEVRERAELVLEAILARPEKSVAVVAHCLFIDIALEIAHDWSNGGGERGAFLENCEVRKVEL